MFPFCLGIAFLLTKCPKNKSDQKSLVCMPVICLWLWRCFEMIFYSLSYYILQCSMQKEISMLNSFETAKVELNSDPWSGAREK